MIASSLHAAAGQATAPPSAASTCDDVLDLLQGEHARLRDLADECRRHARTIAPNDTEMRRTAQSLCALLRRLSEIEEGLFYPLARAALPSPALVDLAALEHATARQIIRQLAASQPSEARYEALLVALSDCVERHVRLEQLELFPRLREAALDLAALGARLRDRRLEPRLAH